MEQKTIEWFSVRPYLKRGITFNWFIGGRGIGKTYSSIEEIIQPERRTVYLRNTSVQLKASASETGNPFKKYNADHGTNYHIESGELFNHLVSNEPSGEIRNFGSAFSLSTFHNMRGVDLSDIDTILFDEFIQDEPLRYDQFAAFCRLYETINRDREMQGHKPVQVIFLSNSQSLNSPILAGFGLIPIIERMDRRGQELYQKGDILIVRPGMHEFMEEKKQTVLYRNIPESAVFAEAINNEFANDSFYNVRNCPIKEYKPICKFDDIYIYEHKNNGTYYACRTRGECPSFTSKDSHLLFMRIHGLYLREAFARGLIYFSEFQVKAQLQKAVGL